MKNVEELKKLCQLIRYDIVTATTKAGSGHPSTCLSAVELMTTLFFNHLKENDRLIFSKGHAAPLLYSLYHASGLISYEELMTLRKFNSNLEGHPTPRFKYVDVATGSLGQGLSMGVGMALGLEFRIKNLESRIEKEPKVYVLLGDSEMAEGQVWEAMQIASYYKLNNLIAILDVNRLGQRGETMLGWDLDTYEKRAQAFGWETIVVEDGHDLQEIVKAYDSAINQPRRLVKGGNKPTMIIAKTIKGKGISFMENKDGWHGKVIPKEMLKQALDEIGSVSVIASERSERGNLVNGLPAMPCGNAWQAGIASAAPRNDTATREAYGDALVALGKIDTNLIVFDAETSNSTYADKFKKIYPERFLEMFIAEQNMISTALGLSKLGFNPFCSSFAAFLSRAFDQIRIAQYSNPNLKIVGSHAGCSIGPDGATQMGLEDLAMARSILDSIVFYPSDAVSTFKLVEIMAKNKGLFYLRTTREKTPIIYKDNEEFTIGGSKIIYQSEHDQAVVFSAGITLHEAIKAYYQLKKQNINIAVVDLYSVKPLDVKTINDQAKKCKNVIVVEDHYPAGGLGEAVKGVIDTNVNFTHLCVKKLPHSGTMEELMRYEKIDAKAITSLIKLSLL